VVEDGAEIAVRLWNSRHPAAVGVLAYPETRAALAAAHRAGRLTAPAYAAAEAEFEALHATALVVGIDHSLARRAGDLAAEHQLRGCDAVHLASALRLGDQTTLITWDHRLRRAAMTAGLAVASAP
jgi:predicted nucleic acid-binding protein